MSKRFLFANALALAAELTVTHSAQAKTSEQEALEMREGDRFGSVGVKMYRMIVSSCELGRGVVEQIN